MRSGSWSPDCLLAFSGCRRLSVSSSFGEKDRITIRAMVDLLTELTSSLSCLRKDGFRLVDQSEPHEREMNSFVGFEKANVRVRLICDHQHISGENAILWHARRFCIRGQRWNEKKIAVEQNRRPALGLWSRSDNLHSGRAC